MIENIIKNSPEAIDLTNEQHSNFVINAVETILEKKYSLAEIDELEDKLFSDSNTSNIFVLLALKIAKSKILASKVSESLFVSVVFADALSTNENAVSFFQTSLDDSKTTIKNIVKNSLKKSSNGSNFCKMSVSHT